MVKKNLSKNAIAVIIALIAIGVVFGSKFQPAKMSLFSVSKVEIDPQGGQVTDGKLKGCYWIVMLSVDQMDALYGKVEIIKEGEQGEFNGKTVEARKSLEISIDPEQAFFFRGIRQETTTITEEGVAKEKRDTDPKLGLKYHALVRLERSVGIRRIEMQNANIGDYFPAQGSRPAYLRVTTAKGGKTVMRPLDPVTAKAVEDWVKVLRRQRSRPDKEALFVKGVRGPRISLRGLNYIFARIREEAGVSESGAGFHAMRRGRVTGLHEGGMSGPEITKEFG